MEDKNLLWVVLVIGLLSVAMGFLAYNKTVIAEVPEIPAPVITDQDKQDIAGLVLANLPAPVVTEIPAPVVDGAGVPIVSEPLDNDKLDALYEDSDLDEEAKAEELVFEELNSRDFMKQLQDVINDEIDLLTNENHDQYELQIDSWRDIEDVDLELVDIEDVDVDDEEGTVEIEFRVKYMLDDDEDEMHKARLTIVYTVEDLDDRDDFDDADVDTEFVVDAIKLYG